MIQNIEFILKRLQDFSLTSILKVNILKEYIVLKKVFNFWTPAHITNITFLLSSHCKWFYCILLSEAFQ